MNHAVIDRYPWVPDKFHVLKVEQNGAYVTAQCPLKCHRNATVRLWTWGDDPAGPALCLKCWAACDRLEILRAVGASWKDCFPSDTDWDRVKPAVTATYPYTDESAELLYQTVRLEPGRNGRDKDFRQRRRDPNDPAKWVYNLDGVRRVLYRLYDVLTCPADEPVLICAGEKDVDSLRRVGVIATTNVCGERAEWLDSYSEALAGKHVVVIEDRDSAGKRHANEVAGSLLAHGVASLRRGALPRKDATAFLNGLRVAGVSEMRDLRIELYTAVESFPTWRAL